jgi:hypothetical protein
LVQEINGLADGNDIDKWYNSRQSLWAMLYFCEFDQKNEQGLLYLLDIVRRCEHSFMSTLDAIAKEATSAALDTFTTMNDDGKHP